MKDPQELLTMVSKMYVCALTRDELRCMPFGVDPKEIYGTDFLGETFRVLKEKEIK